MAHLISKTQKYIYLLGLMDNLHDFDCILSNVSRNNYFNFIKLIELDKQILNNTIDTALIDMFNKIFQKNIEEKTILESIIKEFVNNPQNKDNIDNQIITNFQKIFGSNFLLVNKITKMRQILYWLIASEKAQNFVLGEQLANVIIKYANKTGQITISTIRQNIKNFDENLNITYPVTFFDDMSSGIDKKIFNFNIINLDKGFIDGAKTLAVEKYLYDANFNNLNNLQIKSNNDNNIISIGFKVERGLDGDVLDFYKTKYYLDFDNKITCNFTDDINGQAINIIIKVETNEIKQMTILIDAIINIIHNHWEQIHSNKLTTQPIFKTNINDHNILTEEEIKKLIEEIYYYICKKAQFIKSANTPHNKLVEIKHLCLGMVIYLLTGMKRFGDWMQMYLSKKLYFTVQTTDQICKAYGIVIGAPVYHDSSEKDKPNTQVLIFNSNPSNEFITHVKNNFRNNVFKRIYSKFETNKDSYLKKDNTQIKRESVGKNIDITRNQISNEDKLILTNINNEEMHLPIRRHYFKKYMYYKRKYIELKQNLKIR